MDGFLTISALDTLAGVMPPKYSDSVYHTVETCLRAGVEPLQIASEIRISNEWVYQLQQVLDAFGTISPPHLGIQGRPRKVTAEAEQDLLNFLNNNLFAYQNKITEFLLSKFNISIL